MAAGWTGPRPVAGAGAARSGPRHAGPRRRYRSARGRHRPSLEATRPCRGAGSRGSRDGRRRRHRRPASRGGPRRPRGHGRCAGRGPDPSSSSRPSGKVIESTPLPYVTLARLASTAHGSSIVRSYGPYDHSRSEVADALLTLAVHARADGQAPVVEDVDADVLRSHAGHRRHDHQLTVVLEDVDGDGGRIGHDGSSCRTDATPARAPGSRVTRPRMTR